jgi:hypothetical protein
MTNVSAEALEPQNTSLVRWVSLLALVSQRAAR